MQDQACAATFAPLSARLVSQNVVLLLPSAEFGRCEGPVLTGAFFSISRLIAWHLFPRVVPPARHVHPPSSSPWAAPTWGHPSQPGLVPSVSCWLLDSLIHRTPVFAVVVQNSGLPSSGFYWVRKKNLAEKLSELLLEEHRVSSVIFICCRSFHWTSSIALRFSEPVHKTFCVLIFQILLKNTFSCELLFRMQKVGKNISCSHFNHLKRLKFNTNAA